MYSNCIKQVQRIGWTNLWGDIESNMFQPNIGLRMLLLSFASFTVATTCQEIGWDRSLAVHELLLSAFNQSTPNSADFLFIANRTVIQGGWRHCCWPALDEMNQPKKIFIAITPSVYIPQLATNTLVLHRTIYRISARLFLPGLWRHDSWITMEGRKWPATQD